MSEENKKSLQNYQHLHPFQPIQSDIEVYNPLW